MNVGVEIKSEDIRNLEPRLALALVAMRYVFAAKENTALFNECTRRFLALKTEHAINYMNDILIYLRNVMPRAIKEDIVDSLEAYKNKGYTSIAEADYNDGEKEGIKKGIKLGVECGEKRGLKRGESLRRKLESRIGRL